MESRDARSSDKWAHLLYGGSFRRFIQVAEVGSRSRSSSETTPGAALCSKIPLRTKWIEKHDVQYKNGLG